jgi:hypothetical protein
VGVSGGEVKKRSEEWLKLPERGGISETGSKVTKTLDKVLRGNADANIRFGDLCALLQHLGFSERIRGDHHIFTRDGVAEILNLQPRGGKAKAYQVKQVRAVITSYRLAEAPETKEPSAEESSSDGEESQKTEESGGG